MGAHQLAGVCLCAVRNALPAWIVTARRKQFAYLAFSLSCSLFASGCLFPHTEVAAPPANGVVVDASNLRPIVHAKVFRRSEAYDRSAVVLTDNAGNFQLEKANFLVWRPMVCYAPRPIEYRVEVSGYTTFITNLHGGGSFQAGRQPYD